MGTLINFFLLLNYYLLMVVMTEYSMTQLGEAPGIAGLSASIFIIGALISRLFCGRYLDTVGRKRMLLIGAALELWMSAVYFFAGGIGALLLVRFLHGASYGAAATAIGTIVTDLVPRARQGEGIGYYTLSVTLGAAIGPFLGMYLLHNGGFNMIFAMCVLTALLCLVITVFLAVPEASCCAASLQREEGRGFQWSRFIEAKAVPISLVCALVYFGYSSLLSFLSSYAGTLHLETEASFFFVIYALAIFVSRPFTGRLFDRRGERITMIPAFLAFAIGMVVLSQAKTGAVLLFSAVLLGFGVGVVQSCGLAIAVKGIPSERLSLVNSTFYICLDLGIGVGPLLLGMLIPYSGYQGMYLSMTLLTMAALGLYCLTWKQRSRQRIAAQNLQLQAAAHKQ